MNHFNSISLELTYILGSIYFFFSSVIYQYFDKSFFLINQFISFKIYLYFFIGFFSCSFVYFISQLLFSKNFKDKRQVTRTISILLGIFKFILDIKALSSFSLDQFSQSLIAFSIFLAISWLILVFQSS